MQSADLHIACSVDQRFAADCAVMLHSLLESNDAARVIVHFLHDDQLPHADLERLGEVVRGAGAYWLPLRIPEERLKAFPFTRRFGLNAWYRTLLPELLPDLDRVLYLDSDTLVLDDLMPLWQTDLEGAYIAAVTQPTRPDVLPRLRDTLGLPDADSYFNSGVMLLDLAALRRVSLTQQVVEFLSDRRAPTPWADQDPLNAILHALRLRLHPRWNVMTPMLMTPARQMPFPRDLLREATQSPAVIHFIGPYKPWHYRCRHPYRARYFEHLAHTPWKGKPIEGRTLEHMLLRPLPWHWQFLLESLFARVSRSVRRLLGLGPAAA